MFVKLYHVKPIGGFQVELHESEEAEAPDRADNACQQGDDNARHRPHGQKQYDRDEQHRQGQYAHHVRDHGPYILFFHGKAVQGDPNIFRFILFLQANELFRNIIPVSLLFEKIRHEYGGLAVKGNQHGIAKASLLVISGLAGLVLGGKWIVEGAVSLASSLGLSQSLVGLTVVAVGTSLPELATSAVAAYKKNAEIAVGNVVGSNIFNVFFVLGASSVIKPLPFQRKQNVDIAVLILANLILFVSMFSGRKRRIDRWEGMLFLLLYGFYIMFLIIQG